MVSVRLGLAGTAKNTGKTTTAFAIMQELRQRGIPFYLTSIGYDGENFDNVTSLPKPKLWVEKGDIVATALQSLRASTASFSILQQTDIKTPLGKIVVAQVAKPGLVVTAGANKSSEVRELNLLLSSFGPGVIILDGALNRIAPMVETDGFILATGAAKTIDINKLALETELIEKISSLPQVPNAAVIEQKCLKTITILSPNLKNEVRWTASSLFRESDVDALFKSGYEQDSYLFIPGIAGKNALKRIAEIVRLHHNRLIITFSDPIKLLVNSDISNYQICLAELEEAGAFVGVIKRIPLLAITVNPFYPEYRIESNNYRPAFVDFVRLQVAVQNRVSVPVYNVMRHGAGNLLDTILAGAAAGINLLDDGHEDIVHF